MNAAVRAYVFNFLRSINKVSIYLSSYIYIHFIFVNSIYFFLDLFCFDLIPLVAISCCLIADSCSRTI